MLALSQMFSQMLRLHRLIAISCLSLDHKFGEGAEVAMGFYFQGGDCDLEVPTFQGRAEAA